MRAQRTIVNQAWESVGERAVEILERYGSAAFECVVVMRSHRSRSLRHPGPAA